MDKDNIEFEKEAHEKVLHSEPLDRRRVIGAIVFAALVGVFLYWYWFGKRGPAETQKSAVEEFTMPKTPTISLKSPEEKRDDRLKLPAPVTQPPPQPAPVVAAPQVDEDELRRRAEEERRQREEEERRKREGERLGSKSLIFDASSGAQGQASNNGGEGVGPVKVMASGTEEDANRRFLSSSQTGDTAHAVHLNRQDAIVVAGTVIRGVLETAIQSDLPGDVRARTKEDVWSYDGRRILIPAGSLLTGEYRAILTRGQTRVFIVWNRVVTPPSTGPTGGLSIPINSYGADDLGRSGLNGQVDEHYVQRFGAAILLSIVGGGSSFLAGLNTNGTSNAGSASISQQAQTQAQQTIAQTSADLANTALKDSINIQPTIYVDQGTRIGILVHRDLDFSHLYPDPVREVYDELRSAKRHLQ